MKIDLGHLTPTKTLILSYILVIMTGALLLTLPAASRTGEATPFINALFTSASATCVTGLVVYDTYTYWSAFGQAIILLLIQIGGLGFVTIAIFITTFTRHKIGLKQRFTMQEAIAAPQTAGIVRMTRFVLVLALILEAVGALLLAIRFCPMFGLWQGIYFAIFHAVSAFCNAGFDLMGKLEPFSSFCYFSGDLLVNGVIMVLIVCGGLGFLVWDDLWQHKLDWAKYRLQTKMVLTTTLLLISAAAIFFLLTESHGAALADKSMAEKAIACLFQAVTPRTAGFNTITLPLLGDDSLFLIILLMLIGGSPGSTAGGFKTTTAVVLLLSVRSTFKKQHNVQCFRRRLDEGIMQNAFTLVVLYLFLFIIASLLIAEIDGFELPAAMFESASALGTVGLSLGITTKLSAASKLILVFLMFFGRAGGLTLLFAIAGLRPPVPAQMPLEKIAVG